VCVGDFSGRRGKGRGVLVTWNLGLPAGLVTFIWIGLMGFLTVDV